MQRCYLSKDLKEERELTLQIPGGKVSKSEASSKSLRQGTIGTFQKQQEG